MHVKHLIWDYNGTLVDDTWLCLEILNMFLEERGMPLENYESYRARFRFPLAHYYRELGFDLAREDFTSISTDYHAIYNARRFECSLHTGAAELLAHVSGNGTQQHVLSAYREPDLREALAHYGITGHFHRIVGHGNYRGESKEALGRALLEDLGAEPETVLVIGDTTHDFEVARAMGARCILVAGGHHPRERLEPTGAEVVDSIEDLGTHLLV